MAAPRRMLIALAAAAATLAVPFVVLAATTEQLVTLATQTYQMGCQPSATEQVCDRGVLRNSPFVLHAVIRPASGEETFLLTQAQINGTIPATGIDALTRAWMSDMHALACGDPKGVADYVAAVGDLTKDGFGPPKTIGNCQFNGGFDAFELAPGGRWTVGSSVIPPPTPGPTATPQPTPKPTATPQPSPTPSAGPSGSPSAAPSASSSVAPSAAPTASIGPSATPSSSGPVSPAEGSPAPGSSDPPGGSTAPPGGPTPPPTQPPSFSDSVLGIEDVNTGGGAVGGSLLLALLMLLIIGFAGELFNNTVENNYDTVSGWFRKGPLAWFARAGGWLGRHARIGVLVFVALTALVSSFVDPNFGPDLRSLAEFLGFLVGLIVVLASFKLPPMLAHRRKTGELGRLRPLPWALVIAALFVLISRLGGLQPGYLYGIVLGAIFVRDVSDREEGRETFYGSFWTLGAAVLAWLGLSWARSLGYDPNGFGITLLSTAFAAILVAGLEATAFGLMPLRFMPGYAVYKFNRFAWSLLFGLSIFAFFHLLIGPSSGYVSELSPEAFVAALGIFAVFGALSIATWLYFRLRSKPEVAAAEG